jgi:hypothetical protein
MHLKTLGITFSSMQSFTGKEKSTQEILAGQRKQHRKNAFHSEKLLQEQQARESDSFFIGRDRLGKPVHTRKVNSFKGLKSDKWYVQMDFGHEDTQKLPENQNEAEAAIWQSRIPRKAARIYTHIIRAVRLYSNIRMNYEREIAETEKALAVLDRINIDLASHSPHSYITIVATMQSISDFERDFLIRKRSAVKNIAFLRLEKAMDMLQGALDSHDTPSFELKVFAACAKLTSVRNRLGQWRDLQIAHLSETNRLKECALRAERDLWLFSQFVRFSAIPEKISEYIDFDAKKLEVIRTVRCMIESKTQTRAVLDYINKNHHLFVVEGRVGKGSHIIIRDMEEKEEMPPEGAKPDYLIGHLRALYSAVSSEDRQKAIRKLEYLEIFVNANKPRFILGELEKSDEPYLRPVVAKLKLAVNSFVSKDFDEARARFADAADLMHAIVNPG